MPGPGWTPAFVGVTRRDSSPAMMEIYFDAPATDGASANGLIPNFG